LKNVRSGSSNVVLKGKFSEANIEGPLSTA
jgi:hypothetical protein